MIGAYDCVDLLGSSGQPHDARVPRVETGNEAVHRGYGVALRSDCDERDLDRSLGVMSSGKMRELGKRSRTRVQAVRKAERQHDGVPTLGR